MHARYVTVNAVGKYPSVPDDAISGSDIFIYTVNTQHFATKSAQLYSTMADQHITTVICACSGSRGDKADIPCLNSGHQCFGA